MQPVHLRSTRTIVTQRIRYLGARQYFKHKSAPKFKVKQFVNFPTAKPLRFENKRHENSSEVNPRVSQPKNLYCLKLTEMEIVSLFWSKTFTVSNSNEWKSGEENFMRETPKFLLPFHALVIPLVIDSCASISSNYIQVLPKYTHTFCQQPPELAPSCPRKTSKERGTSRKISPGDR